VAARAFDTLSPLHRERAPNNWPLSIHERETLAG
jgi:hypothetical protein